VSNTNPKRADEEYDRRVTELWFFFRLILLNEQIRGLDPESAMEFCRRWWTMRGNYISLETKAKMKDRTRHSPDLADADVVTAQRGAIFHPTIFPPARIAPIPHGNAS
jgi:hypothetical protein